MVTQNIQPNTELNSRICSGQVRHRRFTPKYHAFKYQMTMLAIDLDEVEDIADRNWFFGCKWFHLLRFSEKDYIKGEPGSLKNRIENKVMQLGGRWPEGKVVMLAQVRCLGVYFSPVNFYFCYNQQQQCEVMLAEVSNTPWNERHYYLVNPNANQLTKKAFHVSPFMDLAMSYRWKVRPLAIKQNQQALDTRPTKQAVTVNIDNMSNPEPDKRLFEATMALQAKPFNTQSWWQLATSLPLMTFKIVLGIYWQALRLIIKKIPFYAHPDGTSECVKGSNSEVK